MTTIDVVSEIWSSIKYSVMPDDLPDVAEKIVSTLVDADFDTDDIKDAFSGEKEILTALKYFKSLDASSWDETEDDYIEEDEWDYDEE